MQPAKRLQKESVLNWAGYSSQAILNIPPLRDGYYKVVKKSITGDAPKNFIRVYEYGEAARRSSKKWPAHIAKVGHKWYPNESITEHFLTRVGEEMGISMADSSLVSAHGQIRFLSRYFLTKEQSLVHGAQLFSSYLDDDKFVDEVEAAGRSTDFFTLQFVYESFLARFPEDVDNLMDGFCRMLAFDALVGNNDRHFYNWGIVVHLRGSHAPFFSPIYDSARAFFWNVSEKKLQAIVSDSDVSRRLRYIRRYIRNSCPKTGLERSVNLNHFELLQGIVAEFPNQKARLLDLAAPDLGEKVARLLGSESTGYFSELRKSFILDCLEERIRQYRTALHPDKK